MATTTRPDLDRLRDTFDPSEVRWRLGMTWEDDKRGKALAYITARVVMDRLDEVFGPLGWSDSYEFVGERTVCTITVWDSKMEHWVSKSDAAGDSQVEKEKGAVSDAFKRAAVKLGVGRFLYEMESPTVSIVKRGRSWSIGIVSVRTVSRSVDFLNSNNALIDAAVESAGAGRRLIQLAHNTNRS